MNTGAEHYKNDNDGQDQPPAANDAVADAATRIEREFMDRLGQTTAKLEGIYDDQMSGRSPNTDEFAFFRQAVQMLGAAFGNDFTSRLLFQFQNMAVVQDAQDEREEKLAEQFDEMVDRQQRITEEAKRRDDTNEAYQQLAEAEEERHEWQQSQHSYAGVTMSGAEWGALSKEIKGDTILHQWLIAQMMKDGMNKGEAEAMTKKVALRAEMESLPPSQWTAEMKKLDADMKADPKLKHQVDSYVKKASDERASAFGRENAAETKTATESQNVSVAARDDILASGTTSRSLGITSDINLTEHYSKAVVATEPLDVPKPVEIAVNTPKSAPMPAMGGLDG